MRKIVICHSFHTMTTGRSGYKKAADPERPAAPFASFIPRIVFSVIRAFRFLHNLCFPEARGPFRSAKSTSAAYRSCPTPGLRSLSLRPSGAPSRCSTEKAPAFRPAPRRRDVRLSKGCIRPCLRSGRSRMSVRVPLRTG